MPCLVDTGCVRSVVIVGYPGVQALDLVGPFQVFTGTGLAVVAQPVPDPRDNIDTLILPGGDGVDDARRDPDVVAWVQTAAGVTAGIELALSLVEDDHGTDAARTVARWLVMYLHRPRRLRRAHPHRGRPAPTRGNRRHRQRDRYAVRVRQRGDIAPQLHSPPRHLTRPVP